MNSAYSTSTAVELLSWRATHQGDRHAYSFLVDGETQRIQISYRDLDLRARTIAAYLQVRAATGERAVLLYPAGLEFIAAFFGCLYAGVVAVPAHLPHLNQSMSKLKVIVADAQAKIALTTESELIKLEPRLVEHPELAALQWIAIDQLSRDLTSHWQEPMLDSDTLALLQYTSGSTGMPKGVMISHGNLMHNQQMIQQAFEHSEETIFVGWLPLFHDMGLIGNILQPLYLGIPCILMSPMMFLQRPFRWLQTISHYRATTSGGPNFAYELCIQKTTAEQRARLDLSSWEVAFNGAEPIRMETLERFTEAFEPHGFRKEAFYPCYGMAEATLFICGGSKASSPSVCTMQANDHANPRSLVGCGHSWLDQRIAIVDPNSLKQCPPGQVGEIWVSGSSVAQGYWNQPEATKQTFQAYCADNHEGPFLRTGDLGVWRDNELFVTGRIKDMVVVRGQNHYPHDLEQTAEQSHTALQPGSGAAFAVEVNGEEQLVLVQEIRRSCLRHLDVAEVIRNIRQALAEQHGLQVSTVVLIKPGSLPKTSSGKIQRHACRTKFLEETLNGLNKDDLVDRSATPSKPFNPSRQQQMTICSDQLKLAQQFHAWAIFCIPLLGTGLTVKTATWLGIDSFGIALFAAMYVLTMVGISVGFHRCFAHSAFRTSAAMQVILAILGSMACQGSLIYWVSNHRRHHQFSDQAGDPHSPHIDGERKLRSAQGFWHAHVGWTFTHEITNPLRFAKELLREPALVKVNHLYYLWVVLGLVIPTVLGGLFSGTWKGSLSGFLWGGCVRLFLTYHATESVNSITHLVGNRPFATHDQSTNNFWLAIPTFGEAWHNNHHAFPNSAIFGLNWWQIDLGAWTIRALELVGLIWDVKLPTTAVIATKISTS